MGGADQFTVRTHDNVGIGFVPAGLGSRFAAQLVDTLVFLPIGIAVAFGTYAGLNGFRPGGQGVDAVISDNLVPRAVGLAVLFAYMLYFALAEGLSGGRTPGKTAAGIRVVRIDGGAIGISQALLRSISKPLGIDFVVGPVMMFFHPLSRRVGDLLAGTIVVRERNRASNIDAALPPPVFLHSPDPGPPIAGVERLGQRELGALRTFLERPDLHPVQRARVAASLTDTLQQRLVMPADALERREFPEPFLERLYVQLAAVELPGSS